ncbi:MAG: hypothetical protein DCC55_01595 [Chloroflexi bacterium]|nr:MAG: hypothetical protein DCC55_01595 [Chloroflexota bacterium]
MNPILDQPQTIDTEQLPADLGYRLANQDLVFYADAATDLVDLAWPWADETYVRYVQLRIVALREEGLVALVTRFYPGYQEVILGNEGMIVSKRLCALLNSPYDRSVLWVLECQAEGDRLLRLEIDIEWAQPLTQRIVDGLLVAQRNPQPARGIYAQSNAESTCVFGNPYGRPDGVEIDDPRRARLVYHVLVNGVVEVPLLLTVSDVGEQMAWNGFLALRDTERAFELSVRAWDELLKTARLWTPDVRYNQAVQMGKAETVRRVQRLRTGFAPSDRDVRHLPALVESLDAIDATQSRNLLAHARRLAERTGGRLPLAFPLRTQDPPVDPGAALVETNAAYLMALSDHLRHHFDASLLNEHYAAVRACADALIQHRWQHLSESDGATLATISVTLRRALGLAMQHHDSINMVRWESEACEMERQFATPAQPLTTPPFDAEAALRWSTWQTPAEHPWHFADPWQGVVLAGQAIWRGCGVSQERPLLMVYPTWPADWTWWALIDLPIKEGKLSLLWDGKTLHTTRPLQSHLPTQVVQEITALKTEEYDFDLQFEIKSEIEGRAERHLFRPHFH